VKERGILFSAPMVRALLAGTKTQTRRVVKPRDLAWMDEHQGLRERDNALRCPHGKPGDRLWVRETFSDDRAETIYRADGGMPADWFDAGSKWRPSIFMPRALSRITLDIVGVRVERLQDISEADAIAEGCATEEVVSDYDGAVIKVPAEIPHPSGVGWQGWDTALDWYADLWESINGPGSWDANPWVWVVEFKRAA
jgi:hypothetical protein